jgi:transposase-like protein
MSVSDIQAQLEELYGGAEISTALISKITDEVMDEVQAWQHRSLE